MKRNVCVELFVNFVVLYLLVCLFDVWNNFSIGLDVIYGVNGNK